MHITFTGNSEDFVDGQRTHAWRRYSPGRAKLQQTFEPIIGTLFIAFGFLLLKWNSDTIEVCFTFAFGLYSLLLYRVIAPAFYRRAYKRRSSGPDHETQITFGGELISFVCPSYSDGNIHWSAIKGYLARSKSILLYMAPARFIAIPVRALTDAQQAELIDLLRQHNVPPTYPK